MPGQGVEDNTRLSKQIWNQTQRLISLEKILAEEVYPGWKCRFYVSGEVPFPWVYNLKKIRNTEVIQIPKLGDWTFSYNRFLPMSEEDIEIVISRDTDSRLSMREKAAVDEWIASDKGFHIMKDHPWHYTYPILAGMFGCKRGTIQNISDDVASFEKVDWYHSDQEFLKQVVHPQIENNVLIHDDWHATPYPLQREGYEFVGQVFDEHNKTNQEHIEILKKAL